MWKVGYREMSPEEREELRELLEDCARPCLRWLGALLGALTLTTVALTETSHAGLLAAAALLGGLVGGLAVRRSDGLAELREALGRDLERGKVQIIEVASREVIRVTTPDGAVAGYFAGLGDGHHLFIEPREWGPGLDRLFPCSRFSLIRAPRSEVDLAFVCGGDRIPPLRDLSVSSETLLADRVEDGDVVWAGADPIENHLTSASP